MRGEVEPPRRPRIGVLTTSYPRDPDDPAGHFVAGFATWLAHHVGDVEVLCAAADSPLFYRGGAPATLATGRVRDGARAARLSTIVCEAARFSARLLSACSRRVRRWDVLVSHWLVPCGLVGAACAPRLGHLAIAHGSDVALLKRMPGGERLIRALSRRSDLVYVARALEVAGAPGRVVAMGIDTHGCTGGARQATRHRLGLSSFTALYLGRLIADKGVDRAIDGLPEGMTLLIAGDGPERQRLEARPARLRKAERVRFLGEVRGAAKRDLLAAADALVVPSRADGAPTVVLEAFAAGLPVVAASVGGIPELVDGGAALLGDGTSGFIAAALDRLRDSPELAEGLAARGRQRARAHDWEEVGPKLAGALIRKGANHIARCVKESHPRVERI